MKVLGFSFGEEDESEERYSSTGQWRSLILQLLLAISPFIIVAILGGAVPVQYAFGIQVLFFGAYLVGVLAMYLKWQRDAIVHLCFPYVHAWVFQTPLPPKCWFLQGQPEKIETDDNLRNFLLKAKSIKPSVQKELEKALNFYKENRGGTHFTGFHLTERILCGAYKGFDNVIAITKSPFSEVFDFQMDSEVLFHDLPVQHPKGQLAAFQIVGFVDVMGERTAMAYVLESSLKAAKTSAVFTGKEVEVGMVAKLIQYIGQVTRFAEDQTAHLNAVLESMDDREKKTEDRLAGEIEASRTLDQAHTKPFWRKMKPSTWLVVGLIVLGVIVMYYWGWLPIKPQ